VTALSLGPFSARYNRMIPFSNPYAQSSEGAVLTLSDDGTSNGSVLGEKLKQLHLQAVELGRATKEVDVRAFEGLATSTIREQFGVLVEGFISRTLVLCAEVFSLCDIKGETCEKLDDSEIPSSRRYFGLELDRLIQRDSSSSHNHSRIADVAFIARVELSNRFQRFGMISASANAWDVLAEYDSALRRVSKSLSALDTIMSEIRGVSFRVDYETELESSLLVRRACTRLRQDIQKNGEPDHESIYSFLRGAGTHIAMLIGRSVYPQIRIRDRAQLCSIQERILSWMRFEREDRREGLRIWEDLRVLLEMFSQISRREELMLHDLKILELLIGALEEKRSSSSFSFSSSEKEKLEELRGMDLSLDSLLDRESSLDAEVWISLLIDLRGKFAVSSVLDNVPVGIFR